MLGSAVRILAGYLVACLAAAATQVLFVLDPGQIFVSREGAAAVALLTAMAATQTATFALPFAVIAIGLCEAFGLRGWLTFVVWGVLIALSGYVTVVAGDLGPAGAGSVYALSAFMVSGAVGGFAYWLIAGRRGLRAFHGAKT